MITERTEAPKDPRQEMVNLIAEDLKDGGIRFYDHLLKTLEERTQGRLKRGEMPKHYFQIHLQGDSGSHHVIEVVPLDSRNSVRASVWEDPLVVNSTGGSSYSFWRYQGDGGTPCTCVEDCSWSTWDIPSTAEDVSDAFDNALRALTPNNFRIV